MSSLAAQETVEDLGLTLVEALTNFEHAYSRWVEAPLQHSGLTYARIRLLGVLNRKGPQIMSALGEELVVSPRNVTALVDALEDSDLVRRRAHPTDRRATIIELTPHGVETCATMYADHVAAVSELFSNLSTADQRQLLRALNLLGTELERRGIVEEYPSNHA